VTMATKHSVTGHEAQCDYSHEAQCDYGHEARCDYGHEARCRRTMRRWSQCPAMPRHLT